MSDEPDPGGLSPVPDEAPPRRPRGRPKLGVVAREITLLPEHWAWLAGQPGGASATLRRLVDTARGEGAAPDSETAGEMGTSPEENEDGIVGLS